MDEADVRKIADGRVLTGEQALAVGLVDELGNYHDALAAAGELGGIEGEPKVKHFGDTSSWRHLLGALSDLSKARALHKLLYDFRLAGSEQMLQMPALGAE